MSPRTEKQIEKLKQKKELSIIESSLFLFSENGYVNTSMQSIAKKAEVSKGNLYNYFESKERLLEGVLHYGMNQMMELFQDQSSIQTEEDFSKTIHANFEMIKTNESFWKLYYNLIAQPKVHTLFNKVFLPFFEQYMKYFEVYFKNKGDKDPASTALLLGSAIDGISLGYIMMGENYPLKGVVDQLIEKFK
ncbi:MAG: TetR/AcrR family transcriptional regulator [Bacteroidota bacterium]